MLKKLLLLILLGTAFTAQAEAAAPSTYRDIARLRAMNQRAQGIRPAADGKSYTTLRGNAIERHSYTKDAPGELLFEWKNDKENRDIADYQFSPDGKLLLLSIGSEPIYRHSYTTDYYLKDADGLRPILTDLSDTRDASFSPDGRTIAFSSGNNLYLYDIVGDSVRPITTDGAWNRIINGTTDWVYEEEFGFNRAFDFSADSQMLAYIRFDESQVPMYSFPLYKGMVPALEKFSTYPGEYEYKYPMPGIDNSKVTVHTFDIKSKVTRKMDLPLDADSYIPRIKFTDDENALAIMTLNRHQNRFDLYFANPRSTLCKLMVRDEAPQYIKEEAYSNIVFYPKNFVVMSEKDGYNHLYLYTSGGNLVKQITKGNFEVKDFLGWDEATNTFYFESNEGSPLRTAIYKVDGKGKKTKLSKQEGTHKAIFSNNMKYYINTYSNINTPPVITLNDNNGKELATLVDNNTLKHQVSRLNMPSKELFSFKTNDGVELNGWIMKPANFNPNKKYPVIMHQYSGPGSQEVADKWGIGARRDGGMFEAYMAGQGFIMACVDGRGTGGRGSDFEKCTYLSLGVKESKDQVEAAKYLSTLPYVDGNRIGIWGWSYGGYNTLMSMSEGTPIFKAGVAVAAPTDWRFYDSVYTERFMRTPKENMEGYNAASAINRANKLNGELLLIHGTADDNVHLRNNAEYSEALVQADKQFDMQIYTNRNHGISGGNTTKHILTRIANFFIDNLK